MAKLNYKEVAHRLRVTVRLLKWLTSHSPKGDGRKLRFASGAIEESEVIEFESYLRGCWPSRAIPSGVAQELLLEAAGKCGICDEPCEHFEQAHIDRKGRELPHYNQHPHNLILLCGSCHGRYDRGSHAVTNPVVRKRKETLLSRLMEDVDRDIALAQIVPGAVAAMCRAFLANAGMADAQSGQRWVDFTARLFAENGAVPVEIASVPNRSTLKLNLQDAGRLVSDTMPVTSGTLRWVAERVESPTTVAAPSDAEAWESIDQERRSGECDRCAEQTALESYTCASCDHWGDEQSGEVPVLVDYDASPMRVEFEDASGESEALTCEACGSDDLEFEFQRLCDYCEHMTGKDD